MKEKQQKKKKKEKNPEICRKASKERQDFRQRI